jgi:hypothetical protein
MSRRLASLVGALALALCACTSCAGGVSFTATSPAVPHAIAWNPEEPTSTICRSGSALECRAACDGGDADACFALAQMYGEGHRVPQDVGRALTLLDRACRAGVTDACIQLGSTWTSVDDARAIAYFARGCHGANISCTFLLQRIDADPALLSRHERISLLERLCAQSADDACGRLKDLGVEIGESSR